MLIEEDHNDLSPVISALPGGQIHLHIVTVLLTLQNCTDTRVNIWGQCFYG